MAEAITASGKTDYLSGVFTWSGNLQLKDAALADENRVLRHRVGMILARNEQFGPMLYTSDTGWASITTLTEQEFERELTQARQEIAAWEARYSQPYPIAW